MFTLSLFLGFLAFSSGSSITPYVCGKMPWKTQDLATVTDLKSSVYLLGDQSLSITKFDTLNSTMKRERAFNRPIIGGQAEYDPTTGHIFYFNGYRSNIFGKSPLYKLPAPGRRALKVRNPKLDYRRGQSTVRVEDSVFIFGGNICGLGVCRATTIEKYNMTSNTVTTVGEITTLKHLTSPGVVYDGEYTYIFGGEDCVLGPICFEIYDSILKFNPKTYEVQILETKLPQRPGPSKAFLVGDIAYILPSSTSSVGSHTYFYSYIITFNTTDHSVQKLDFGEVNKIRSGSKYLPSAYVPDKSRIYIFGAAIKTISYEFFAPDDIICLDVPFVCNGREDGDFAHPTDCTKFITCSNEFKQERNCPAGLHFNAGAGRCDYPENANCVV